jgi:hypothetical protein
MDRTTLGRWEESLPRRKHEDNSGLRMRVAESERGRFGTPDLELTKLAKERREQQSRRRFLRKRRG